MPMKPKEMVKYLKKNGFNEVKGGGKADIKKCIILKLSVRLKYQCTQKN